MDIFCRIINGEVPSNKVYEDDVLMVIMDVNPRSNGHLLIIPKKHYKDLFDIDQEVLNHIMEISKKMAHLLIEKLDCKGVTLEENNGNCQEVRHFHLHIIPKYDKNEKMEVNEVFQMIMK